MVLVLVSSSAEHCFVHLAVMRAQVLQQQLGEFPSPYVEHCVGKNWDSKLDFHMQRILGLKVQNAEVMFTFSLVCLTGRGSRRQSCEVGWLQL